MDVHVLRALIFPFFMALSGVVFAAPIDDQTPIPNASVTSDYTFSRRQCIHLPSGAAQPNSLERCVSLDISYPVTTSGIDAYIRGVLIYRLSGQASVANTLPQAVDGFLSAQVARLEQQVSGSSSFAFSWQILGQHNGFSVLAEQVRQHESDSDERLLRQFTVLEGNAQRPLDLADILVSGQGEALAKLQESALLAWLVQYGRMQWGDAQITMAALPYKYSENWAISRNGVAFGYDPLLLDGKIQLPLVVLSATELEGVVRPDILSAARSWPVDLARHLGGLYQQGVMH
ncbi:hypothetical protein KRX19_01105 [Cardiobacteriaceae bacterium TAE3-ERU3]|nr:hypothetical protein [Cardiobacteriaceae bacterium TAE3-ERU3]